MSEAVETGYERLGAALAQSVDEACDRFEQAWQSGQRPLIENFRDEVPEAARSVLVGELVLFEVGFRQRAGEKAQPKDYRERFPELQPTWLERVFAISPHEMRTQLSRPSVDGKPVIPVSSLEGGDKPAGGDGDAVDRARSTRLGRFEIRRELGRGGFGVVHLAHDPLLGREVALKVPHAHVLTDPELRSRFQREARSTAGLNHPNIVPVYEAGEVDSVGYIALAYCPGITLHDWLRRRIDSVSGPAIAEFMAVLAGAIHHAHQQGVIHRDLKPANVLLGGDFARESDHAQPLPSLGSLSPKITDFGLAKLLDADAAQTRTGIIAGTPCYMAPEQTGHSDRAVGPATDVYSLGAILYELLTGRAPFQGETVHDTLDQVRNQDPISPRRLRPGIPRDLEIICLKCLEKDPLRRYSTAQALEEDFRRYLSGHSIVARPTGPLSQLAKWARRRPAVAALVCVCLAAAAVLVASDLYIRQQKRQTERALQAEKAAHQQLGESLARERLTQYFQRVRLAQAALRESNVHQAERYLEDCLPGKGESDVRGWEWHHLKRLCHQELMNFREHAGPVWDVAIGPGDRQCASLGTDGTILVWDTQSGKIAWRSTNPGEGQFQLGELEFSPVGELLAVSDSRRNEITLYSTQTGQRLRSLSGSEPHFRGDGARLAAIDGPRRLVQIYDPADGKLLATVERALGENHALAFRGDNLVLASADGDGAIRVWEGDASEPRVLRAPPDNRLALQFSADGRYLATKGFSGNVHLWDVATGAETVSIVAHRGAVKSLAFSSRGQQFASADILGEIKIWDLEGRLIRSLPGHGFTIPRVRFSDDGRRLISASLDRTVKIWDLKRDRDAVVFRGHANFAYAAALSSDGRLLASSGSEGGVRIRNAVSGDELRHIADPSVMVRHLAFRPDSMLVGCDAAGAVQVWNPTSGERLQNLPGTAVQSLTLAALSRRGSYVAVVSGDRKTTTVRAVPPADTTCTLSSKAPIRALCFTDDEERLAVATADGNVTIYTAHNGQRLLTLACGDVERLAISSDGQMLATAGNGEFIHVWNATSGKLEHSLHTRWGRSNVYSLAFGGEGRRLASGAYGAAVTLWDTQTGEEVVELPTHYMGVTAIAFSEDGWKLAAIINDGSVAVWDATPWLKHEDFH